MLFKQNQLVKIKAAEIKLAFRKWHAPRVKAGSLINTSLGRVQIISIEPTDEQQITDKLSHEAGYASKSDLLKVLNKRKEGHIYKIKLKYHSIDPRIELRSRADVDEEEMKTIEAKLNRLDRYSAQGVWTQMVLSLIALHPETKAADLAAKIGKEKQWLKLNVRKLKNMGLTISHGVGYSISPLGQQVLEHLKIK